MKDFKELDELLKSFVEETLTEQEQKRLEDILKTDSSARQRYLDYIEVESMLGSHRVKVEHAETLKVKPKLKVHTAKSVRRKAAAKPRNKGVFLIVAASLFLAFGLAYYMKIVKKSEQAYSAKIAKSSAGAQLIIQGKTHHALEGLDLASGTEIHSSQTDDVSLLLKDGSSILLAPASALIVSLHEDQFKLTLKKGFIKANVNKQPAGKPLIISTSSAQMSVLGTTLRVSMSENTTTLTVDEGRVEIQNSQKQKVLVNGHETVTAQSGKDLQLRSLEEFKVSSLEILSAFYGAGDKWVDLSPQIRARAGNSRLIQTGSFKSLAGDPNYGTVKSIKVTYKINGRQASFTVSEYSGEVVDERFFTREIILPLP